MKTEFGFLKNLKNHFNLSRIGDDCAVFPKDSEHDYVVSSDMLVENVDFRLDWTTPNFIGHKALAVSISDIAAMGGNPLYSMVSLAVPETLWKTDFPEDFYKGYMSLAGKLRVELIGGDISKTGDRLVIDSTVIGQVPKEKAILRSGAKAGDLIFVTGTLGGAAAGLLILEEGGRYGQDLATWQNPLVKQQLRPNPFDGSFLVDLATSAIDISDGLSSDLGHICEASGVGAKVYSEKIPVDSNISGLGLETSRVFELALSGGEDFALLFTIDAEIFSGLRNFPFSPIGEITEITGNIELIIDGISSPLDPEGYKHF